MTERALKDKDGKVRYDLLPSAALEELARVYTKGAEKYEPNNWMKGRPFSECFSAMMRHAWKYWRGEDLDPETGCHHMSAVAFWALELVSYHKWERADLDDRAQKDK